MLATDLVRRQVSVIAATSTPGAIAAKALGLTIPPGVLAIADEVIE